MGIRVKRVLKRGEIIEVKIVDFAFGGVGIAKMPTDEGDFTIFVQNAIPGQRVMARVVSCKRRHAECKLDAVLERSPDEVELPYQAIPGAPYARLPLEIQHKYKVQTALDVYRRIGGLTNIDDVYEGLIHSPNAWHYRNKMEYSFSAIGHDASTGETFDGFALGFKHRGTWWIVENLDRDSGIFDAEIENGIIELRKWCEATGLPAWHPPKREGFFRFLVFRKSTFSQRFLINLVSTSDDLDRFDSAAFIQLVLNLWGDRVQGILHTLNDEKGDRVETRSGATKVIWGDAQLIERINELDFSMSMSSFFQTNPASAERLYDKVVEYVGQPDQADGVILDLFCGTGTIAQLLARRSEHEVIGVDLVESAIEDAARNAELNQLSKVKFFAADVGKFLNAHPEYSGRIASLVLDPPRAGIAPKTLQKVIDLGAKKLVYVSCNPATQARDAQTLALAGYRMTRITLVDQFPHTAHIEAVATFEKA